VSIKGMLEAAEVFDSWRVVPRIIIGIYVALFVWTIVYFSICYFGMPASQRTVEVTAFSSVVLTAMSGAFPFVVKIYMDNGRDWNARGQQPPPP
jgi:hypothetical protein